MSAGARSMLFFKEVEVSAFAGSDSHRMTNWVGLIGRFQLEWQIRWDGIGLFTY